MNEFARPPRGWLKGVIVTILIFWYSGLTWQAFQSRKPPLGIVGMVITILGAVMIAQQALTNDGYRTSTWTRLGNVLLLLGMIVFFVGSHL